MYEYDVFISYQRHGDRIPVWVRNHFGPLLHQLLETLVSYRVKMFLDEQIPVGDHWPSTLESALLRSRVLIPICSPHYFQSAWCLAEWHSMTEREKLFGLAERGASRGLIYPILYSDSENFPRYALDRQMRSLKKWNSPSEKFRKTRRYLSFEREMEKVAADLVTIIDQAPEWQPDWPVELPKPAPPTRSPMPRL